MLSDFKYALCNQRAMFILKVGSQSIVGNQNASEASLLKLDDFENSGQSVSRPCFCSDADWPAIIIS